MESIFIKSAISACSKVNSSLFTLQFYKKFSILRSTLSSNYNLSLVSENIRKCQEIEKTSQKSFHTQTLQLRKRDRTDRKTILASAVPKEEGTEGENSLIMDNVIRGFGDVFPDESTPDKIYDGVKFSDLPIVHVKVSRNNTILGISDAKGNTKLQRSCGMDGFKNTKKGTNIAAQVTGQTLGMKALEKGFKNVRVAVQGLGAGRVAALKGLTLSGINVVSISDVTPISFYISPRPRKAKKN